MKTLTAFTTLFFFFSSQAQKIIFSEPEKAHYASNGNYIIGRVKDNILICKYAKTSKETEILVYDEMMKLKGRIPFNTFAAGDNFKLDFVNHGNYFDAVIQYYSKKVFYCKAARFNEVGKLLQKPVTIDSARVTGKDNSERYSLIQSENKTEICLLQALIGVKKDCLQLSYRMLNNDLTAAPVKKICVPFRDSFTLISPINLDNEGSLVFAEYTFKGFTGNTNMLGVFKIEKNSILLLNTQQDMDEKEVTNLSLQIDNNNAQYFISGSFQKPVDKNLAALSAGIFTGFLHADLSKNEQVNFYDLYQVPGLKNAGYSREESFTPSNIIGMSDGGYTLLYNLDTVPQTYARYSQAVPESPTGSWASPFAHPVNNDYNRVPLSNLGVPAAPLYNTSQGSTYSGSTYYESYAAAPNRNYPLFLQASYGQLLLVNVSSKNEVKWSLKIGNNVDPPVISVVSLYQFVNTGNKIDFIFPQMIEGKIGLLGSVTVNADGVLNTNAVISNEFDYHFQTGMGAQIDNHSIIFPCEANGKLAFAKMEF